MIEAVQVSRRLQVMNSRGQATQVVCPYETFTFRFEACFAFNMNSCPQMKQRYLCDPTNHPIKRSCQVRVRRISSCDLHTGHFR